MSRHHTPVLPGFKLVQRTFNASKSSVFIFQLNIFSVEKKMISLPHHAADVVPLEREITLAVSFLFGVAAGGLFPFQRHF